MTDRERPPDWVDFEEVKERVLFDRVLSELGLINQYRFAGEEIRGRCPFCKSAKSFGANIGTDPAKNPKGYRKFHCFACKKYGDVIDFTAALREVSKKEAATWLLSLVPEPEEEPPAGVEEMPAEDMPTGQVEGLSLLTEREQRIVRTTMYAMVQAMKAVHMAAVLECERIAVEMQKHQEEGSHD